MSLAEKAASHDGVVLLSGESGTGKDHLARWIHDHSARALGPFFAINYSGLPAELAEAEEDLPALLENVAMDGSPMLEPRASMA